MERTTASSSHEPLHIRPDLADVPHVHETMHTLAMRHEVGRLFAEAQQRREEENNRKPAA
jgi:hypothetical protein